jgi:hypothetical protein
VTEKWFFPILSVSSVMDSDLSMGESSPVPRRTLPVVPSHAISRVDRRGIHAWRVCLKRRGHAHIVLLHDHDHGGAARARRAAEASFLQALRFLPPPLRTSTRDVRSKTGVVGVSLERLVRPKGRVYSCYRAVWPLGRGRYKKRAFSIARYGKRKAFRLAVLAREQGIAQLARSLRERIDREIARRTTRRRPSER